MAQLNPPVSELDHKQGELSAPIVLVEYGDFECEYCGLAYPILKKIRAEFGQDLCFVFRHFPLTETHLQAFPAACAAEAAGMQAQFWSMHDLLFENQTALSEADLFSYAAQLNLSIPQFTADFSSDTVAQKVETDVETGFLSGVNATPTFYINGRRYDGSYGFDDLSAIITTRLESVS